MRLIARIIVEAIACVGVICLFVVLIPFFVITAIGRGLQWLYIKAYFDGDRDAYERAKWKEGL